MPKLRRRHQLRRPRCSGQVHAFNVGSPCLIGFLREGGFMGSRYMGTLEELVGSSREYWGTLGYLAPP